MGNHDRMKAADTYYSIHPYTFIASYKNVRLKKRIGTATNTYTDETELKLALSAVTIRSIRDIVPLQVHSRVTPAPRHSTPLISIIWNGANRYSVP